MKTKKAVKWWMGIALAGCMLMAAACDDAETGNALNVEPAESSLYGAGSTVLLTASVVGEDEEMILPLKWSVQNPSLGNILSSAGLTAVYRSNGAIGQNVVFCKDNYGREGLAVVNQKEPEILMMAP
jgi:hypothetical protein